jgi:hypothetical protein
MWQARQERRGAAGMSLVAERLFVGSELSARSLPNLQALSLRLRHTPHAYAYAYAYNAYAYAYAYAYA